MSLQPVKQLRDKDEEYGPADLPAAQPQAEEQARIPRAHGHQGRPRGPEPAAPARPEASGRDSRDEVATGGTGAVAAGAPDGQRFPRTRRLTRGAEIREVMRRGKRSGTSYLDVFDFASPLSHPRVGIVVPRYGHGTVERNLLKRRLREIARRDLLPVLERRRLNIDIILRAKRQAYEALHAELRLGLVEVLERRWLRGSSWS